MFKHLTVLIVTFVSQIKWIGLDYVICPHDKTKTAETKIAKLGKEIA